MHTIYIGKLPECASDERIYRALVEASSLANDACDDDDDARRKTLTWTRARASEGDAQKSFGFASFASRAEALRAMRAFDGATRGPDSVAIVARANAKTLAGRANDDEVESDFASDDAVRARARTIAILCAREDGEIASAVEEGDWDLARASANARSGDGQKGNEVMDEGERGRDDARWGHGEGDGSRAGARGRAGDGSRADGASDGDGARGDFSGNRAVRFNRHAYEANERIERLFREREKAVDDIARATTRERARRAIIDKEKKADRRRALKRDVASDGEGDDLIPLWERSERERARRRRFRDLEKEDDARDAAAEIEEARVQAEKARVRAETDSRGFDGDGGRDQIDVEDDRAMTRGKFTSTAPPSVSGFQPTAETMKMHAAFGLSGAKKSGLTAALKTKQTLFSADEDDENDEEIERKRRRFDTLNADKARVDADAAQPDVESLIRRVPTDENDIFAYAIDWNVYVDAKIDRVARKWMTKKITELLGEPEPALVDFIADKLERKSAARALVADLDAVLDIESLPFVLKLWRLLIFEILKAQHEV